jgi:hypothetical protein
MLHSHGLKTIVLAQAPATFQEQSPGWRWHQTFQRLGEWWEYQGRCTLMRLLPSQRRTRRCLL